jgi:hypothetical protein
MFITSEYKVWERNTLKDWFHTFSVMHLYLEGDVKMKRYIICKYGSSYINDILEDTEFVKSKDREFINESGITIN